MGSGLLRYQTTIDLSLCLLYLHCVFALLAHKTTKNKQTQTKTNKTNKKTKKTKKKKKNCQKQIVVFCNSTHTTILAQWAVSEEQLKKTNQPAPEVDDGEDDYLDVDANALPEDPDLPNSSGSPAVSPNTKAARRLPNTKNTTTGTGTGGASESKQSGQGGEETQANANANANANDEQGAEEGATGHLSHIKQVWRDRDYEGYFMAACIMNRVNVVKVRPRGPDKVCCCCCCCDFGT